MNINDSTIYNNKLTLWHITFVLFNSRYAFQNGMNYSKAGYIANTYNELNSIQQEILAEELEKAAKEYNIKIIECNICNDHFHSIVIGDKSNLSLLVGKWKGRSSYQYNRRVNPAVDEMPASYSDGTISKLWAKGFHKQLIYNENQLENTIHYIRNNRKKHNLPDATPWLNRVLRKMVCSNIDFYL